MLNLAENRYGWFGESLTGALTMAHSRTNLLDFQRAMVVTIPGLAGAQVQAVTLLIEEVEKRSHIRLAHLEGQGVPAGAPRIVLASLDHLDALSGVVPAEMAQSFRQNENAGKPEGFQVRVENGESPVVFVIGSDTRGMLYGVGYLLRKLRLRLGHNGAPGRVDLPADVSVSSAPAYALRGHQLGYRDKTNSYDGWDVAQYEQYYRDLLVFGANAIELIPPVSDDEADSVHFPLPPFEMMREMSRLADQYDLDLWIWYPAMESDYDDPATMQAAEQSWRKTFSSLPRINAVFVPGGDPGHTPPRNLMALLALQKAVLSEVHPGAQLWVSPQGFTQAWMDEFMDFLESDSPDWLDGVVFGPWVQMSMADFRRAVPARYPIRNYPDITHSLNCQFPVPEWDLAFALTLGREGINPRPEHEATIFRLYQPDTIGFLTYSEGCNDDVNKAIWSGLGWDPAARLIDLLRDYSRYFIGDDFSDDFAQGLLALERNWRGPLAYNTGVTSTLLQFQDMERRASPFTLRNWRFQQALYRAYYDALVRSRLLYETGLEEQAMDQLRQAEVKGALEALRQAEEILDQAVNRPISLGWRTRLFQLAEALFQSIAMQLDTRQYKGQYETRGANLNGVDTPLNNRPWLKARFAEIRALDSEADRMAEVEKIVNYTNPGPGGRYTDLGNSVDLGPVRKGPGFSEDPAYLRSAMRRFPYLKDPLPVRYNWRGYTGAMQDVPLELCYDNLEPESAYRVRVVYSPLERQVPLRLDANGIEVHPYLLKEYPVRTLEYDIPLEATRTGALLLALSREPGWGRSGVGADISEIWLMKVAGPGVGNGWDE
jgi:hypothetical protein